jgi:ABC transport system ATP-binding/permease protein
VTRPRNEQIVSPPQTDGGLEVYGLGYTIVGHEPLVQDVCLHADPGTLTAIIGPSGAGKTTLAQLISGALAPTVGRATFHGLDIHAEYGRVRSMIGMVPQDDVVHRQLGLGQALGYAAELRLPADSPRWARNNAVSRVLAELELTDHAHTRVDRLSCGQRKRASVAMELLTGPALLILDEPTSGLDPALDRQVMVMLRELADAGRVVVVVTHSLANLDECDQVLFLAPGGKTAFCGPPGDIARTMGTACWADIFASIGADPDGAHDRYLANEPAASPQAISTTLCCNSISRDTRSSLWRQIFTVARRQVRLTIADRGYFAFLALLPFVLGALSLVVPGQVGMGVADPYGRTPNEPAQIVILLNMSAIFMGTALTIKDLVAERPIFQRERAVGLSATAYLSAKIAIYAVAAATQAAILTAITIAGKGGPTRGPVLFGTANIELYLTLAATSVIAAVLGLALSAVADSSEQVLPLFVASIMVQIVFCGGLIPVTGRVGLDIVSWLLPSRWGFAATASTVDLRAIAPFAPADEALWDHTAGQWLINLCVLALIGFVLAGFTRFRLRLRSA